MKARVIALYLPQFHPISENDEWWGKGFTEWTNVGKAKKLFRNHYQPVVPADLGYYDLRVPETRKAQADMAKAHGIEGFCYWHYWFGNGKRLLERPFNEVLLSNEPDFPFCLAWANESWKGFSHGLHNRNVLIEQKYPGDEDYIAHFNAVLPAFKDRRYITIDGKPLFMIYKPKELLDIKHFIELWINLALKNGLSGIHFIAHSHGEQNEEGFCDKMLEFGFDSINFVRYLTILNKRTLTMKIRDYIKKIFNRANRVYPYRKCATYFSQPIDSKPNVIPTIIPNWDHSPRSGRKALIMTNSTPELFGEHVSEVLEKIKDKDDEHKIVFIKSWNEWAEGNYMEPDLKWGRRYLETLKKKLEITE
jgi:hypothetical protein